MGQQRVRPSSSQPPQLRQVVLPDGESQGVPQQSLCSSENQVLAGEKGATRKKQWKGITCHKLNILTKRALKGNMEKLPVVRHNSNMKKNNLLSFNAGEPFFPGNSMKNISCVKINGEWQHFYKLIECPQIQDWAKSATFLLEQKVNRVKSPRL